MSQAGEGASSCISPMGPSERHTRVTNWTLESAGSSTRKHLSPRQPSSLRTDDIAGATSGLPYRSLRYSNKPSGFYNDDIPGSKARRAIPETVRKRNDYNITNADIEHSSPESKAFKTKRVLDPLDPVYTLSSYPQRPITPPMKRGSTCKTADIPGSASVPLHQKPARNHIDYSDVPLSKAGTLTAARKRQTEGLGLEAKDINFPPGAKGFNTKRCTNPLQPAYSVSLPPGADASILRTLQEPLGSRPRQIRNQRMAGTCSLSLRSDDVEGAQSRSPVPFPQQRRQWRATCNISDIPAAKAAGKFHQMHGPGQRCTDPCNPRYLPLEAKLLKLPPTADTPVVSQSATPAATD